MLPSSICLISSLLSLATVAATSSKIPNAIDCRRPKEKGQEEECARPIEDVVAVVPGVSYVAKVECKDCPFVARESHQLSKDDQIFLLNITLAHDNRTVLLDDQPLYPLPTIPVPPRFWVKRYATNFTNTDLTSGLTCSIPSCQYAFRLGSDCAEWCNQLPLSDKRDYFDYLYITQPSKDERQDKDEDAKYWDIALDIIGSSEDSPAQKFDHPEQAMLWMRVKGTPVNTKKHRGSDAADPFGHADGETGTYEYQIVDMRLVARAYNFSPKKSPTIFGRIGHFFGSDVWQVEGSRFLYLAEEWGNYGKKGTLRDTFGEFIHWHSWDLIGIILGSVIGGIFVALGLYRFVRWIMSQRELMKWDGMEDVWENMRRQRIAEEEDALLRENGGYRDDPDDGGEGGSRPPAYTDTPAMKPLPSKPLPEKPLPAVPLIDA